MGSMATIATGTTSAFLASTATMGLCVLVEPTLSPVGLPILLNVSVTLPARLGQGGPLDHIAIYSRRTQRNAGQRARYTRHNTKLTIVGVNRAMPADQAVGAPARDGRGSTPRHDRNLLQI